MAIAGQNKPGFKRRNAKKGKARRGAREGERKSWMYLAGKRLVEVQGEGERLPHGVFFAFQREVRHRCRHSATPTLSLVLSHTQGFAVCISLLEALAYVFQMSTYPSFRWVFRIWEWPIRRAFPDVKPRKPFWMNDTGCKKIFRWMKLCNDRFRRKVP